MKTSITKSFIALVIGLFITSNLISQEVNMDRWIEIVFDEGWSHYTQNTISMDVYGDFPSTTIKVVSGHYVKTRNILDGWGGLGCDMDFFIGSDTMRIYGDIAGIYITTHELNREVDANNNPGLIQLHISAANLRDLRISNCTNLLALSCGNITYPNIDLSSLTELDQLFLYGNIDSLDLSNQTKLTHLRFQGKSLKTIDVSHLKELSTLDFFGSSIENIDVRGLNKLNSITCFYTEMSTAAYDSLFCALPETDCGIITVYNINTPPRLYDTIIATNSDNAVAKGWKVYFDTRTGLSGGYEHAVTYGTFDCSLIGIDDIVLDITEAEIYPNPVTDKLNIETRDKVLTLEVFDALGRRVIFKAPNQTSIGLDISTLKQGVYILKLQTKQGIGSYKIVKN